jgi:hypothetical protein
VPTTLANKKAGIPINPRDPGPINRDYTGNFGLDQWIRPGEAAGGDLTVRMAVVIRVGGVGWFAWRRIGLLEGGIRAAFGVAEFGGAAGLRLTSVGGGLGGQGPSA